MKHLRDVQRRFKGGFQEGKQSVSIKKITKKQNKQE